MDDKVTDAITPNSPCGHGVCLKYESCPQWATCAAPFKRRQAQEALKADPCIGCHLCENGFASSCAKKEIWDIHQEAPKAACVVDHSEGCIGDDCGAREKCKREAPKAAKAIDDLDCTTCPDQGLSACLRCDGVGPAPKDASQGAEELVKKIRKMKRYDTIPDDGPIMHEWRNSLSNTEAEALIESAFAAQRQAGREEALGHIKALFIEEEKHRPSRNGQYSGHCHDIIGIWDSDNGPLAGKECAVCAVRKLALFDLAAKPDAEKGE